MAPKAEFCAKLDFSYNFCASSPARFSKIQRWSLVVFPPAAICTRSMEFVLKAIRAKQYRGEDGQTFKLNGQMLTTSLKVGGVVCL